MLNFWTQELPSSGWPVASIGPCYLAAVLTSLDLSVAFNTLHFPWLFWHHVPWFSAQCCLFPLRFFSALSSSSCSLAVARGDGVLLMMFSSRAGAHPVLETRPSFSQCFLCLLRGCCWRTFHLPVPWASPAKMSKSPVPLPPNNLCLCPSSPAWATATASWQISPVPLAVSLFNPPPPFMHWTTFSFSYLFLATLCSTWNFSNHESNPCPLQWKRGILTTGPPEKLLNYFYTYNSLALITFTMLSNHHHHLQNTCTTQPENLKEWIPHSPSPQPLVASHLLSIFVDLPVLDISCQWSHTICGFCVWLLSLSIIFSKFFHVVAWISIPLLFISV